jgi:hypothetical protein
MRGFFPFWAASTVRNPHRVSYAGRWSRSGARGREDSGVPFLEKKGGYLGRISWSMPRNSRPGHSFD